jgi:hypothetical protein
VQKSTMGPGGTPVVTSNLNGLCLRDPHESYAKTGKGQNYSYKVSEMKAQPTHL